MCGVLGSIGGNIPLGNFIYCLELLNTRGQEATGIAGFSKSYISEKCQGTAENLGNNLPNFDETLELCIGSTRYPTIGSLRKETFYKHIAPFTESTSQGLMSLVFNGNILNPHVNGEENDGALLTKTLKKYIDSKYSIYDAVKKVIEQTDGAFSVIAMLGDNKLIAFRDRYGFRPLCWGKIGNEGYVVASESRILEKLGITTYHVLPRGSLFVFQKDSFEKHRISFHEPKHCMFEWTYFSQAPSVNEGKEVYQVRYNLGQILGKMLREKGITNIDYVIPVPNTSRSASVGCADFLGIKYADGLIKNRSGRIFIKPKQGDRDKAVKKVYETINSVITGKNIILIDDSIVRGTTLARVIKLLRFKGVKSIHVGITTPKIHHPCCYGIDMSRPGELLAANKSEEEIAKILDCDSLTYITQQGLIQGIGLNGLCMACLDGKYPTKEAQNLFQHIKESNKEERYYEQSFTCG